MKKQTSLHINIPCHENWNGMQPSAEGRFCRQCSRQVTDFTLMTDQQILTFLSSHSGNLCGRFTGNQLNRPLAKVPAPKKRNWYIALSLPLLFLFQKGTAQVKGRTMGAPVVMTGQSSAIMGDTVIPIQLKPSLLTWMTLHGLVTDEKGVPIWGASIVQKGTMYGTASDSAGRFFLQLPVRDSGVTVVVSYVGFGNVEKWIATSGALAPLGVALQLQPTLLGEVAVTGGLSIRRSRKTICNFGASPKISRTEKIDSALQKITGSQLFTVFPNPAAAGSEVSIRIKKEGSYKVQLLDNGSHLLQSERFTAAGDGAVVSMRVPAGAAADVYYLRVTNTRNGKSCLEKLVVR